MRLFIKILIILIIALKHALKHHQNINPQQAKMKLGDP